MGKRKRDAASDEAPRLNGTRKAGQSTAVASTEAPVAYTGPSRTVQIVVGSYERVLHGITADLRQSKTASGQDKCRCSFADTFLFQAHSSAVRCLAVSPMQVEEGVKQGAKVVLASGSTDERINLYHLSTSPPSRISDGPATPTLSGHLVLENPKNREVGSLLHHSAPVTALDFPTRSKLLSSAEDNTIAITRARDWTALSTIKVPLPPTRGRPSGDTAPAGGIPAGVNDFAVHPSRKVMLSVSKGERCMRLCNLVTGKKAGVLKFDKKTLQAVGESKSSTGEARKLAWNDTGEEFVVGFERGAVVYKIDCRPKCLISSLPPSKLHQMQYVKLPGFEMNGAASAQNTTSIVAASTEDGRILFFSTKSEDKEEDASSALIPTAQLIGELGGKNVGLLGRVKDFALLPLKPTAHETDKEHTLLVLAGSSDGAIRLWGVNASELVKMDHAANAEAVNGAAKSGQTEANGAAEDRSPSRQLGQLLGTYETGLRITCLVAFVMLDRVEEREEGEAPEESASTDPDQEGASGDENI